MPRKTEKTSDGRRFRDGERQKSDGRYEYRYYDVNGIRRSIYSWRLTEADPQPKGRKRHCEPLRVMEERIRGDLHDGIDTFVSSSVTLNERFDLYISNKANLAESTKGNYMYMYDHCVRDTIGRRKICDINSTMMKTFYIRLITEQGFQPATVDNIHTLLNPVFSDALDDNLIRKNPCTKARKEVKNLPGWNSKEKVTGLTATEQRLFVDYLLSKECYKGWVNIIITLLGTGMRISELRGLCWEDISFEDDTIRVSKQLIYSQWIDADGVKRCYDKVTDLKTTASERTIPLQQKVREALLNERERQKTLPRRENTIDGYNSWVFLNRYGLVMKATSVNNAIERIIRSYNSEETEQAKSEGRKPVLLPHQTNHMLRHSFCTRMVEACCDPDSNISIKLVQYLMGHEDSKTTLDIYTNISEDFVKKTMQSGSGKIYLG